MIPVNTPVVGEIEKRYLMECIDTGWISSEGPFVAQFEHKMATYVGRRHGVAVANGSAALDIAVRAIGIKAGDEVIMPTFTIISPAASVVRQGGIPVLVDSDPYTWNMCIDQIEAKITPKTKAIVVIHIYGLPVEMDPVLELARKYGLKIIEDAAEMHGQTYKGKACGSFGDISIFSFYPNKHITTGEGGMVMTDDDDLAEYCKMLRNLCFKPGRRFIHDELGWNYRMTNLQAALGLAQLEQIDAFIARKRAMGKHYQALLKPLENRIQLPLDKTNYAENIYWIFGLVPRKGSGLFADKIISHLASQKIGTRPFFFPMHLQPVFRKMGLFKDEMYPLAEYIAEHGFYIPSGLALTDQEMDTVGEAIIQFCKAR